MSKIKFQIENTNFLSLDFGLININKKILVLPHLQLSTKCNYSTSKTFDYCFY